MTANIKVVQLSKDSIIAASLEILNAFGLADMTMRRVATQLDVAPGALYWHFKNKQALIDATARTILADFLDAGAAVEHENLTAACMHMRLSMLEHRDGAELVSAALTNSRLRSEVLEVFAATLPDSAPAAGVATALHFVVGATVFEQTEYLRIAAEPQVGAIETEENPLVQAQLAAEKQFGMGLTIITTGLAHI